jgi:hypothetical protein
VMLAILSSIGPIVAFFSISTTSYSFMVLLNVAVFGVAGILGLSFLLQTLHRISIAQEEIPPAISTQDSVTEVTLPARARLTGSTIARFVHPFARCSESGSSCSRWSVRRWVGCYARSSAPPARPSVGSGQFIRTSSKPSASRFSTCSSESEEQ